jgi:glycosyltransferase involved in cell wall biosynthesis
MTNDIEIPGSMRILHVTSSLDPAQGGPPVVAINLAKAQAALGHDVRLAAERIPGEVGLPTTLLPGHGTLTLWQQPRPELLTAIKNSDIVHMHGVWEPLLMVVAKTARQLGRPYVVTPHGMLDPWSLRQSKWKKKAALALGYRRMLNHAAMIHALNADEKRLLEPLNLASPCEIIPNGIFLDELNPPPDLTVFRQHRPGPGDRPYILFLSRLHHKKGLDYLADAFSRIVELGAYPQFDLVVAGPDDGEEQPFRQRVERLGIADRVWITGPLYGPMKWSALAGAVCFCLPSRQEGFSVAILEAMACAVPVVVSDQCHFPEIDEVDAGRIVPLEPKAIAAAIQHFLRNPVENEKRGQAGRKLVEERFTWPRVAKRSLELYSRHVSHSSKLHS